MTDLGIITCGIDIGSRTIEVVLFNGKELIGSAVHDTGAFPAENAQRAFQHILKHNNLQRNSIARVVATGYGRNYFPAADKVASEIVCHAAGICFEFPQARTIIDIGGQDSKMILTSPTGKVINFVMNDRCAAGTGKFIEMVAKTIAIPLEKTGESALSTEATCEISSMCAVFAESEIIGLLHRGVPREVILRGVFKSVAKRTMSMGARIALADQVVFTGGVALNQGVVHAIQNEISFSLHVSKNPQITGALGAALIAYQQLTC